MMTDPYDQVICPGCGWIGVLAGLGENDDCPTCGYENGIDPYRLLTLREILTDYGEYNDVGLKLFLEAVFNLLGIGIKEKGQ